MNQVLFSIALFGPVIMAFILGLLYQTKSPRISGWIASLVVWVSFACIGFLFLEYTHDYSPFYFYYFTWLESGNLVVPFAFQADALSLLMGLIVTGVGGLIHVYAIGYMAEDKSPFRFFAYLNLFIFAMLMLVFGANLPIMFIGWEGVGLCSYLLIGYWYEDMNNCIAGMKAFVVNRIGDLGFILGIFGIFALFNTLSFSEIMVMIRSGNIETELHWGLINFTALCLFIGAVGKSAQIPLYIWLPDAMAGPTPVSALIHAATMVTAGLVMVARMGPLYDLAPLTREVVLWVGVTTAIFAAIIGICQKDIKKVLAYSTVSQLGYMFAAMGVGAYAVGMFHVFTHAFFKALLFMGSGSVIVAMHHEQDMFNMGGLKQKMPITFWTMVIGTLALAGIFPFAGFFSKDEILFNVFVSQHGVTLPYVLLLSGAFITAFYMMRLIGLTFFGPSRGDPHTHEHVHETSPVMTVPLMILAACSLGAGFLGMPYFMSHQNVFLDFFSHGGIAEVVHHEGPAVFLAIGSLFIAVLGLALGYYLYIRRPEMPGRLADAYQRSYRLVLNKFFVDEFYNLTIIKPFVSLSRFLWRWIDELVIDGFVNGVGRLSRLTGNMLGLIQTGNVQTYAVYMLIGSLLLLLFFIQRFWLT